MEISINLLKAAALFASTEQVRYYLNGVLIRKKGETVHIIATDGKVMFAAQHNWSGSEIDAIMPLALINQIKTVRGHDHAEISTSAGQGTAPVNFIVSYAGAVYQMPAIDGSFPDYPRIVPREISGEAAQYDPEQAIKFKKAAKILGTGGVPFINQNGGAPGVVRIVPSDESSPYNAFGLIMPMISPKFDTVPYHSWIFPARDPQSLAA